MATETKLGHIDQRLSDISISFQQEEFVQDELFPEKAVSKGSDEFTIFDKQNLHQIADDEIGKHSEANQLQIGSTTDNYAVKNYALVDYITEEDRDNADDVFEIEVERTEALTSGILLNREIRGAALATGLTTNFSVPGVKWDVLATSTPVADIEAAANTMFIRPNVMIISRPVFDILKFHPDILAKIGGGFTGLQMATVDMFKTLFGVDIVKIAGARSSSTKPPKAAVLARVWGDNVVLARVVNPTGKRIATFGCLFAQKLGGGATFRVRKWEMPGKGVGGTTAIQVEHRSVAKVKAEDYGFVIKDALT